MEHNMKIIGKVAATEKNPTTIDEFFFWTAKDCKLKPFDVIKAQHLDNSFSFGVIEEIYHMTDAPGYLSSYISSDFGDVTHVSRTDRLGMNLVQAKVIHNTKDIYTPVLDGSLVSLASENEIVDALGLKDVKNPLPCGYIEMYEGDDALRLPVQINAHFLIGPEGAHLNISGISGLAAKTSYAMFLLKAIQDYYSAISDDSDENVAFVFLNVKGRDLLAIDQPNDDSDELENIISPIYEMLKSYGLALTSSPFKNVKYFLPYSNNLRSSSYARNDDIERMKETDSIFFYKYMCESGENSDSGDMNKLDLLFANVDDPQGTMDSIITHIITGQGAFGSIKSWDELIMQFQTNMKAGNKEADKKEIPVLSWRKFYRIFSKTYERNRGLFANCIDPDKKEVRLSEAIAKIKPNECFVIDIAKLDEDMQGFVFGDVMRTVYDMKLAGTHDGTPSKLIIFIDELNKYASKDTPKTSQILRHLLEITERGRSLGIILFAAEQFRSDIHDRIKGNCAMNAYGRTNVIETSKPDYGYIPKSYKSMLSRLSQGEYLIQNPLFRSPLNIKFPKPIYKQYKNG